ncbi:hypothetical protein SDC9_183329 [bioreactor metagenome]|uniref:Uncharacterized protein n=1 Tax=bioreactor metagenome TaxID=1076179 RepID=A0A645H9X5_9ZZZZ
MEPLCRRICDKDGQEIEHHVGDKAEHLVGGVVCRHMAKTKDDQNNFQKTSGGKGRYNGLHNACNEFKEGAKQADQTFFVRLFYTVGSVFVLAGNCLHSVADIRDDLPQNDLVLVGGFVHADDTRYFQQGLFIDLALLFDVNS